MSLPIKLTNDAFLIIEAEIKAFTNLNQNWDGYGGIPLTANVLENSKLILGRVNMIPEDFYPNPHGTMSIDYQIGDNRLSIEIGISTFTYYTKGNTLVLEDRLLINEVNLTKLEASARLLFA